MLRATPALAALLLAGCASTYQMTLMPRDSGRTYAGVVEQLGAAAEGRISVTLDGKAYSGTWVQTTPAFSHGWVSGGFGFGRRGWGALGSTITFDNPQGGEAKALLTASDGSGLRCDLKTGQGRGGGTCRDDAGREYDVQLRPAPRP